jgi:hypothetical protein
MGRLDFRMGNIILRAMEKILLHTRRVAGENDLFIKTVGETNYVLVGPQQRQFSRVFPGFVGFTLHERDCQPVADSHPATGDSAHR